MRFAFFGYDFSNDVLRRLLQDGHECSAVFSFETDNIFAFHNRLQDTAQACGASFTTTPVQKNQIDALIDNGCKVFISAGYPSKIPVIDEEKAYGINFHPTLLPHGRGFMPMSHLLLEYPQHAGVTAHKLAMSYDTGDILLQEKIDLSANDDIDTLSAKVLLRMQDVASRLMADLPAFWQKAKPQSGEGSWWKPYPPHIRTLDFAKKAADINALIRAFGRYGMLAEFDGKRWAVFDARAWEEKHTLHPGMIAAVLSREVVIAVTNGFVILKEFKPCA